MTNSKRVLVWRIDDYNTPEKSAEKLLISLDKEFKGELVKVHTKNMEFGVYTFNKHVVDRLRVWMNENAPLVTEVEMEFYSLTSHKEVKPTSGTQH